MTDLNDFDFIIAGKKDKPLCGLHIYFKNEKGELIQIGHVKELKLDVSSEKVIGNTFILKCPADNKLHSEQTSNCIQKNKTTLAGYEYVNLEEVDIYKK